MYSSFFPEKVLLHDEASIRRMRAAAQLARRVLDLACQEAVVGRTTDEIDGIVHEAICEAGAYPSPLNYAGFPKVQLHRMNPFFCFHFHNTFTSKSSSYAKIPCACQSLCASVNEVICHGIPTPSRELKFGDVVSFDVSCFLDGVHGKIG